jgi:KUP system potassium uptake protein
MDAAARRPSACAHCAVTHRQMLGRVVVECAFAAYAARVTEAHAATSSPKGATALTVSALGIVFGDIGTSPLYTLHECLSGEHGASPTSQNVHGILSMIFWSLMLVVGVKYLTFIMRADNRGEGGILALLALVPEKLRSRPSSTQVSFIAGLVLVGAALLYGDGIITPSISVLSAVEGLETATDKLQHVVVPITCVILVGLFVIQRRGTASVGRMFGPVMVLWFVTIGLLGLRQIIAYPAILGAISPIHALDFFARHGLGGVVVLGGVVLAVTGGEALYADMGHFGPKPIRRGWWIVAMPALVLNYFGQGALMMNDPRALANPFYALVQPGVQTYMLVVLAAAATIIASQALISGAFSLTHQAVQLGYFPRVRVMHTSREAEGQIYVPIVNWLLMLSCVTLVLGFAHASRLASAYGIAVTGTMAITSIVYYVVARETWGWSRKKAVPLLVLFLSFDVPFFGANLIKVIDGGYVPLLVGAFVFAIMLTWKRGRALLLRRTIELSPHLAPFIANLGDVVRVPSIGVYTTSHVEHVPPSVVYQAKRMHVLPKTIILFNLAHEPLPSVAGSDRVEATEIGSGFYRVIGHVGFMERPNVPAMVEDAVASLGLVATSDLTYFVSHDSVLAMDAGEMSAVRESIFAFLLRNAEPATRYFGIPPDRVIELGMQYDL